MTLYSHSRISCFEKCPFRFKLKYIDRVKPEIEQSIEAFMGSMVHDALEKLYKDLRFRKTNTLDEILAYFNEQWKKNLSPSVLIVRKDYNPENYRQMGETFIRDYYNRHKPFDSTKTVGLEQRIVMDLNRDGKYKLQGYIDRLAYRDGIYEIHDYKTNSSLPQRSQLEEDRQLALYALAVREKYPNAKDVKLVWHFLSFNQDIVLEKSPEELEKLRKDVIASIDRIESASEHPAKPSKLCEWCEFRSMCPEWSHVAKTEKMSLKDFMKEPGVSLVNRYADLMKKKDEIESQIDDVKAKILEYSKENNVSNVAGSGCSARIWRADKFSFPGRNDDGRKQLEDFVRKAGIWEDVSSLDTFALSRAMDNPPWPDEIARAISKFGSRKTIERIYLRKK